MSFVMKNRLSEALLILVTSAILLTVLSFFPFHYSIFRSPDFLADLKPQKQLPVWKKSVLDTGIIDSAFIEPQKLLADSAIASFGDLGVFFESLYALNNQPQPIHIAYFGDSMIEGDLLTMDLRKSMQDRFGGQGLGYMPMTSSTAAFRSSISHHFNEDWTTYNFNNKPPDGTELGWSGYTFNASPGATAEYKKTKNQDAFKHIELFYKSNTPGTWEFNCNNHSQEIEFNASDSLMTLTLEDSVPFREMSLRLIEGTPSVMGLNFENGPGVYVDNYSFRGNSGIPQSNIPDATYRFVAENMTCRLVVLHYGLNIVAHEVGDYSWYMHAFRKTIRKIKGNFPNANIVIASVGDKSYKSGQHYHTEPDIPLFVGMQAKLAREEGVIFWNMYQAMGGYDTMKEWVETEEPRKAAKDYTHFSHAGAAKVASLFYSWLMKEYELFLEKKLKEIAKPGLLIQ